MLTSQDVLSGPVNFYTTAPDDYSGFIWLNRVKAYAEQNPALPWQGVEGDLVPELLQLICDQVFLLADSDRPVTSLNDVRLVWSNLALRTSDAAAMLLTAIESAVLAYEVMVDKEYDEKANFYLDVEG